MSVESAEGSVGILTFEDMDVLTPEQRRRCMSANKAKDTKPEMIVRSKLHRMGFRFRVHRKDLYGNPDIVLPRYRTVIFVHGCYWHRHDCKWGQPVPKKNREFWQRKFARNVERDAEVIERLRSDGWKVLTIWECEAKSEARLEKIISKYFLSEQSN